VLFRSGLPVVMKRLADAGILDPTPLTVNGKGMGEYLSDAVCYNDDVIRSVQEPLLSSAGIAVLKGNLSPSGALIKPCAATPRLLQHTGPAVVFDSIEHMRALMDTADLVVDENSVLVLKGCGPRGYPGFPEVGNMPLPKKLLKKGVKDMVRISDARMSGTAYGTVVLHCAPESAVGGPLALVATGDSITLDTAGRGLHLNVSDAVLAERRLLWKAPPPVAHRGYAHLYTQHVMQADTGADFDFLAGSSGANVGRHSH